MPGALLMDLGMVWLLVLAVRSGLALDSCILMTLTGFFFLCLAVGFAFVGPKRKKFFTADFLKQFEKEHKAAFGETSKLPVGEGYPDTGSGRYALKLPYKQWFQFNVGQRLHLNFLETLVFYTIGVLAVSLKYP